MFAIETLINPGFSWQRALSMASASKLSYERQSIVENVLTNSWGYDTVQFFDAEDTECFVAESDTHAVLAFRGTKRTWRLDRQHEGHSDQRAELRGRA